jgi:diguanylate cyclase (GGDEF)-like protein
MLRALRRLWRYSSITAKFGLAFAVLLGMLLFEAAASLIALNTVHNAEEVILASAEIRQRVFEMDGELEKARRLHRDFFLQYASIGFTSAEELYFKPSTEVISHVVSLSEELKRLIEAAPVSAALRKRNNDLTLYLSTARRFSQIFSELVSQVTELAAPGTGLEDQLRAIETQLEALSRRQTATLLPFRNMVAHQRGYMVTRQRPDMQSALNAAFELRRAFRNSAGSDADTRIRAMRLLDDYSRLAHKIPDVDVAIRSKLNDFTLQARAVDPISASLKALATGEVERAQTRIRQASRLAAGMIVATALTALAFSFLVAIIIHASVTRKIVALTRSVEQMRDGGPGASVDIDTGDELGVLAAGFNDMSARMHDLVTNLEEKVRQRTQEVTIARDRLETLVHELDDKNQALEILSVTDRLTGLANRRKIESVLQSELLRARRYGKDFSVILLDIDRFKNINDTYGHTTGDEVLKQTAGLLGSNARETDLVGRWGGEEFLVVCPETSLSVVAALAERYRIEFERFPFIQAGRVTCSFGVTACQPGDTLQSLIQRADAALYRAKEGGRNRVEIHSSNVLH